jgi:hypothetical protein
VQSLGSFPAFYGTGRFITGSQELSTYTHPEPNQSSPQHSIQLNSIHIICVPCPSDADYYEKQPLFERVTTEPVRLTPAWEETNLPNDELNFKGVTMEQAVLEMNPPTDRYKLQKYGGSRFELDPAWISLLLLVLSFDKCFMNMRNVIHPN